MSLTKRKYAAPDPVRYVRRTSKSVSIVNTAKVRVVELAECKSEALGSHHGDAGDDDGSVAAAATTNTHLPGTHHGDVKSALVTTEETNKKTKRHRKRRIVPQHVLDKWVDYFIAKHFTPFESVSVDKQTKQAAEPQHFADGTTNTKWKKARVHKVSGTKASKLTCQHDHIEFDDGLRECLWDNFQETMDAKPEVKWKVEFGHKNEPNAARATVELLKSKAGQRFLSHFATTPTGKDRDVCLVDVQHKEYGFVQGIALPFGGTSPDGVMELRYSDNTVQRHAVEFKCKTMGWMYDKWPKDMWPEKTLYAMMSYKAKMLPIPTAYYVQIMWCVLFMGKHKLEDIFKAQGHPKHFARFKEYLEPHLHKARSKFYGSDMLDANVPIMFGVWAPGNVETPHTGEPEIYKKMCFDFERGHHVSVMAKCPSGCIQLTMVEYDHEFAMQTLQYAFYSWRTHWLPRLAMKKHGMLLKNELDLPMDCTADSDSDDSGSETDMGDYGSDDSDMEKTDSEDTD